MAVGNGASRVTMNTLQIGDELVVNESNSGYHYFRVTEIYRNESMFSGFVSKQMK